MNERVAQCSTCRFLSTLCASLQALATIESPANRVFAPDASHVSDSGFEASTARSGASIESLDADTLSSSSSGGQENNHQQQQHLGNGADLLTSSSMPNLHQQQHQQQQQQPLPTWIESQRAAVLQKENRKFAEAKKELRTAIADIRTSLKIFMEKNER